MLLNILSVGNKLSEWESAGISYYLKQLPKTISEVIYEKKMNS